MQDENKTIAGKRYQYSIWQRLAVIPAVLISIAAALILLRAEVAWIVLLVLPLFVVAIILPSMMVSYSVTLHPEEIQVGYFRKQQVLRWDAVGGFNSIGVSSATYTLHDHNQRVKVLIDSEVADFPIVNEYIREHLPQLWNDYHEKIFSIDKNLMAISFTMFAIALAGVLWGFLDDTFTGLLLSVFFIFIFFQFILPLLRAYRSIAILGGALHLQPVLGSTKTVSVEEIESISLQRERFRSRLHRGVEYSVMLTLDSGRKLRIPYMQDGSAVLVNTLRNWWLAQSLPGARR
ncbi:MAG: hypothetical protein KIT46_09015 [Anaerolineales bacterium]|nr:hypothetical protein [Anaerolineales bacterium]MCW5856170.1 hypothetical protein [Anaerolineales bacterium]